MNVDYLRVSVTDRCNLRCVYCHPVVGCSFVQRREILRLEEIYRIVRLFVECGIRRVRLTGGEPLSRRNILFLVEKLAGIEGIEELTLTTNGVFLAKMASKLKDAGLDRVNVSLDSTESQTYKEITGFDLLPRVIEGIDRALEVGLTPVKINSVIIKSINTAQILSLAQMSMYLPVVVRFIEYCPTNRNTIPPGDYVSSRAIRDTIETRFGPLSVILAGTSNGPAVYYRIKNSAGTIGFISGRSSTFCQSCNRLRLTSDGKIKPCLYSAYSYNLKAMIRNETSDRHLLSLLKKIVTEKGNYTRSNSFTDEFSMQKIGG